MKIEYCVLYTGRLHAVPFKLHNVNQLFKVVPENPGPRKVLGPPRCGILSAAQPL